MKKFEFNEKEHLYTLGGKPLTGVTTILGVIAKPALIQWAANEAVECVDKMIWETQILPYEYVNGDARVIITDKQLREILETARTAHARKRDKSADIGTLAHSFVETYIKTDNFVPVEDKQVNDMVTQFIVWAQKNKVKFLASEKTVWSREFFFGGTFDFLCEMDGRTYLGDYKTSSGIYFEMFLQCAAYQLALQEHEPELKIDGHIIINTTKTGILNVETHYDYEATKEGFLACLKLYRLLNQNG